MKKKKIAGIVLGILLAAGLCWGIIFIMQGSEEVSLKENQKYIYGYVTSIQGNEMTYMEIEETVIETMMETEKESTEKESTEKESAEKESIEKEDRVSETEEASNGGRGTMGSMPSGGERSDMRSMPSGGEMPNMENMPSGGEMPNSGEMSDRGNVQREGLEMEITSAVTVYIPVGITVHTAADVATTFSRLASDDLIKMLVETSEEGKDIIEEIWMLQ